jgi:hypothetical protein
MVEIDDHFRSSIQFKFLSAFWMQSCVIFKSRCDDGWLCVDVEVIWIRPKEVTAVRTDENSAADKKEDTDEKCECRNKNENQRSRSKIGSNLKVTIWTGSPIGHCLKKVVVLSFV